MSENTQLATVQSKGLTSAQVEKRIAEGKSNVNTDVKTQSVPQILAKHTLTLFNGINLLLAVLVALTGQWRNMLFMLVVFFNLAIGVFQEVRAKRLVDKLTILTRKLVRVLRDGKEVELPVEELVLDDVFLLSSGDQVPADARVVEGSAALDESLLTGESDAVEKDEGSELFSGSFVQSGSLKAQVIRVGADGYAARIGAEAKHVKDVRSEILLTLKLIIRTSTIALVPIGIVLFAVTYFSGNSNLNDSILSTVAAVVGMIPQGLVLLTSTVLAIATTRLATRKVLVQQSYCIETLARVDTVCLDKTGTITSGAMHATGVRASGSYSEDDVLRAAASVVHANEGDANATARALIAYFDERGAEAHTVTRAIPFASKTKLSGCVTKDGGSFAIGAAQFLFHGRMDEVEPYMEGFDELDRVLAVAQVDSFDAQGVPVGEVRLMGLLSLADEIRPTAAKTMEYFVSQGVDLKVISGDDPRTVSAIARAVGIPGAERYVDASTLDTDEELEAACAENVVFGRVTPYQKRSLVQALHAQGRTVAMTGDGVNDVLALKEADCSVSMASGSAAARNISEIVLADNDFAHMPEVVAEGRRSINNLQRSSVLFLVKTVYSALLALVCILLPPYPFIPIQMSLISSAIIGVPSFVLALEPNHERVRGNYLANVLSRSLPASVAITLALLAAIIWGRVQNLSFAQVSTICCILTCVVGILLIVRISWPPTPLRIALLVVILAIMTFGTTLFSSFFEFAPFTADVVTPIFVIGAVAVVVFWLLYSRSLAKLESGGAILRLAAGLEEKHGINS